jgi:DNA-binding HxlR family transcriptional regulator
MSRDSLKRTLETLIREGLVLRNPGYGHPMRPEYILTPAGTRLAPWCVKAERLLAAVGSEEVTLRKWSLAVAFAIGEGHGRFSEMMEAVPGVSARALAMTLKNLQEAELVERMVREDYPPTPIYRLTRRGRRLTPLFAAGIPPVDS